MAAPRKDNVKDIIMNTTEALLQKNSIDNLTLANIATAAGVSKGTLYYHYKAKEDILVDITTRYLAEQREQLKVWIEDKEKDTSLHRLVKYVVERNVYETGPRLHLLYNACIGNEAVRKMIVTQYQEFQSYIASLIEARVEGIDPDFLSWMILLVSDGLIIQSELKTPDFSVPNFISGMDHFAGLLPSQK